VSHRESAERLLVAAEPSIHRRSIHMLLAAIVHAVLDVGDAIRDEWVPVEPRREAP
jgi:hypothetical protein